MRMKPSLKKSRLPQIVSLLSPLAIAAQLSFTPLAHADSYEWWAVKVNADDVHKGTYNNTNESGAIQAFSPKGAGVTLAIVDTGVSAHTELINNSRLLKGYDAISKTVGGQNDINGHGTHVAGIAAAGLDGKGIVGIAPDAWILPIKVLGDNGSGSIANIDAGISWAIANTTSSRVVYNMSLGGGSPFGLTSLQNIKNKGSIAVMAAGNDRANQPAYPARYATDASVAGWALVVGAVDSNNAIASFSNKAGSAANYYLVAPGVSINSTYPTNTYVSMSGTSMATPMVSGAAAVVWGAWRYLKGNQVFNSLLWSATDLGTKGVDTTYGWGLLNLEAAMQPIGNTCLPTLTNSCQSKSTGSKPKGKAFASPTAAGVAALQTSAQVIGFDSVGRHFAFSAANLIRPATVSIASQLPNQLAAVGAMQQITRGGVSYSYLGDAQSGYEAFSLRQETSDGYVMMFRGQSALPLGVSHHGFNAQAFAGETMKISYLSLVEQPMGMLFGKSLESGWGWRMAFITSTPQMHAQDSRRWQLDGNSNMLAGLKPANSKSVVAEASKKWGAVELVGSFGQLAENGAYLGAVNTDSGTVGKTQFSSLSAVYDLSAGWNVMGQINRGVSRGGMDSGDVRYNTTTQSSSLGLLKKAFLNERDQMSFAYSLPARVTQGQMQLAAAVDVNMETGQAIFGSVPVNLTPGGRERRLELLWSQPLKKGQVAVSALRRYEPNHNALAAPENILGLKMQHYLD